MEMDLTLVYFGKIAEKRIIVCFSKDKSLNILLQFDVRDKLPCQIFIHPLRVYYELTI